jgi:D-tagatose-1,6-bisphosphate aldolase subunit GatZ/KbaZ
MPDLLRDIIQRNRSGQPVAIPSVCTAHPQVLLACLRRAAQLGQPLVVEATSNQVNQDGGYTGMRPADFITFVTVQAENAQFPLTSLIFGGDHLGPQAWRKQPAAEAMTKARTMIDDYVKAGFQKIHLDCSEGCAGEPGQVGDAIAAARAADLAQVAVAACDDPRSILFVIGTEVPPPGGARMDEAGDIPPTTPQSALATLKAHRDAFISAGLEPFLSQIGGLVVQPGVEFSPMHVHHLPLARDPGLLGVLADWPNLCLEAHSTDYQHPEAFHRLAELGFAFQKVGPALTFAFREAIYALDALAHMAGWTHASPLPEVMEALMLANPGHWQAHYHAEAGDLRVQRQFGLADRIRYYWPAPVAQSAVHDLLTVLQGHPLPVTMLSQAFPPTTIARAAESGPITAQSLIDATVSLALDPYFLDVPIAPFAKEPRR